MTTMQPTVLSPLSSLSYLASSCDGPAPRAAFWRRTVSRRVAHGWVGGAVLACAAGIVIARAWLAPPAPGSDASQIVEGVLVAIFLVASVALSMRLRELASVIVIATFGALAHGGVVLLTGQAVGALFVGVGVGVALLMRATFAGGGAAPRKCNDDDDDDAIDVVFEAIEPATRRSNV